MLLAHARRLFLEHLLHVKLYAAHEKRMRLHDVFVMSARSEFQAHAQLGMLHLFPGFDQPRTHKVVTALQIHRNLW